MLTQEQIVALATQEDKCYFYGESPRQYVDLTIEGFQSAMNKAYAAGMAAGEAKERERSKKVTDALDYVIRDLELRANMKFGKDKGLVAIGDGAYRQAKAALKEQK